MNMSIEEKAQKLAEMYQKVADGGQLEFKSFGGWVEVDTNGPAIESNLDDWRIKSEKKVVDLSVLADSDVDCEFWDYRGDTTLIDKLRNLVGENTDFYEDNTDGAVWKYCRPRMNHVHAWQGGSECPLPEGFKVKLYFRQDVLPIDNYYKVSWEHWSAANDIIAFEVLGLADGWCYPWEQEK